MSRAFGFVMKALALVAMLLALPINATSTSVCSDGDATCTNNPLPSPKPAADAAAREDWMIPFDFSPFHVSPFHLSPFHWSPFHNSLFKWSPEDLVVFKSQTPESKQLSSVLKVDLVEGENDFHVHADLPGFNESEFEISIDHNNLLIQAQREHKYENATTHRVERSFGKVQRSIHLPPNADQSNVAASYVNGVLTVTFPKKTPSPATKKVPVSFK